MHIEKNEDEISETSWYYRFYHEDSQLTDALITIMKQHSGSKFTYKHDKFVMFFAYIGLTW